MLGHVINLLPARSMWLHCNLFLVSFFTSTTDPLFSLTHDLPLNSQKKNFHIWELQERSEAKSAGPMHDGRPGERRGDVVKREKKLQK